LQALMVALMTKGKPDMKYLAPAALWGFAVDKKAQDEDSGVTVTEVLTESAAAKAELKAGDRLLTLDDRWTDTVSDCYVAAGYIKPGTEVKMRVKRDGKELELTIKPQMGI